MYSLLDGCGGVVGDRLAFLIFLIGYVTIYIIQINKEVMVMSITVNATTPSMVRRNVIAIFKGEEKSV